MKANQTLQSFVTSEKDLSFETGPKSRMFEKMWEIYLESLLDSVHGYPIPFFEPEEFWEFFKWLPRSHSFVINHELWICSDLNARRIRELGETNLWR